MKFYKFGFGVEIYNSQHEQFTFMNNRLMNARLFWFLTKNKTIKITVPMPRLYYQTWDKEKGWQENNPTRYKLMINKIKGLFSGKSKL